MTKGGPPTGENTVASPPNRTLRAGIARVQREFARRGTQQLAGQATRNPHAFAAHVGAGVVPEPQRLRIAPEFDADFLEDRFGIGLDDLDRLRSFSSSTRGCGAGCRAA